MRILDKKIDFMVLVDVKGANPNGDPLQENHPREDYEGYGEISDVCIKRKIRNRLQDLGNEIFVKSSERIDDGLMSLESRYDKMCTENKYDAKTPDAIIYEKFCENWIDVRGFGQVITFKKRSIGIRGPISINLGKSLSPIEKREFQITRSTNGMEKEGGKSSDTMGTKTFVEHGVYLIKGSINAYFSEKTKFTYEDMEKIKEALRTLFVNDSSAARPDGSMEVKKVFWFEHISKIGEVSSAKIFDTLEYNDIDSTSSFEYEDYEIKLSEEKMKNLGIVLKNKGEKGKVYLEEIDGI